MTVGDLIAVLKRFDADTPVLVLGQGSFEGVPSDVTVVEERTLFCDPADRGDKPGHYPERPETSARWSDIRAVVIE